MTPRELYHTVKQTRDDAQCLAAIATFARSERAEAVAEERTAYVEAAAILFCASKMTLLDAQRRWEQHSDDDKSICRAQAEALLRILRARATPSGGREASDGAEG